METSFKGMGYQVQTRELSHFHDDYGLQAGEDENEDEDEDEDDEDDDDEDGSDEDSEEE